MSTLKNSRNRLTPDDRKNALLKIAVKLAEKRNGLATLQRAHVAEKAGCSAGLITHYFGGMDGLRDEIIRRGVVDENLGIIRQAIVAEHAAVRRIDASLKDRALNHGR